MAYLRPPRWWTELPLVLIIYGAYTGARLLARGDTGSAVDNGLEILRLERLLHLNAEEPLNRLFTDNAWLGVPGSYFYAALHYLVTPALLVWIFRRQPLRYRLMRTWLLISTLLGLIGFTLAPTCPPRLLDPAHGFTDSLAQYSSWGWWAGSASAPSGLGGLTNQYAAMPSLHVGWALWCGVALWWCGSRSPLVRAAAVGYPVVTAVVVMGTANHYLLDALAGVAVMGTGFLLARPALLLADRVLVRAGLRQHALPALVLPGPRTADGSAGARARGHNGAASPARAGVSPVHRSEEADPADAPAR